MVLRLFICLVCALSFAACGDLKVARMGTSPAFDNRSVSVSDLRTSLQKSPRRDSNFSAIVYLGEEEVDPPALSFLISALQRRTGSAAPLSLEIAEFRVIDFFPVRLRAFPGGLVGKAIMDGLVDSNTDLSFVEHIGVPESENSVICIFVGKINGKAVKTATFRTYKESPMAVSVRNDESFKRALVFSIEAAAADLLTQARA